MTTKCVLNIPLLLRQPFIDWIGAHTAGCYSQAHLAAGGDYYFSLLFDDEKSARKFKLYAEFHGIVVYNDFDEIKPEVEIVTSSFSSRLPRS